MSALNNHPLIALAAGLALALSASVPAAAQNDKAAVTLDAKTSGGTTLVVDEATLPNGGFVAIHDSTINDGAVLKSVVGASDYLSAGSHEDVEVRLSEPLTEDAELVAMPHEDTDGNQVYSFVADNGQTDGPYTASGAPVIDSAQITVSATVAASDQPTDGQSILIDSVEMDEGGFVAIHDDRLLESKPLASNIGTSQFLSAGHHSDVRVELDREVSEEETLIPMPHEDSNDNQEYDFVTSGGEEDPPYKNDEGKAVIDQATVTPRDTATATFADQSTGGEQLYIERVFLPEGGFVTMHDSSFSDGDTFESVRGTTACLEPGLHTHVPITLDQPLESGDTLSAMPHKDTNDNCNYDFVASEGDDDGPYTDENGIVTDSGEVEVSAMVHYHAQESDGRTITIASVDMAEGGFVAVHTPALLAGQVAGSVVGSSEYLPAGAHSEVEVELEDPIRTSQILIPMPHKDTNGDEEYGFVESGGADDGPYTDKSGAVVDTGPTTVRSQVTLESQQADDTVTVASVTLHDGGFVTLHDDSLLDGKPFESVVGTSDKLSPGTHEDVEVPVDGDHSGEKTLIGMPHYDSNENDEYDFVKTKGQNDGPYTASGSAVVHPNAVTFPTSSDAGDDTDDSTDDTKSGTDASSGGDDTNEPDASQGNDNEQSTPGVGAAVAAALLAISAVVLRRKQ